jgi:hypothetical protein
VVTYFPTYLFSYLSISICKAYFGQNGYQGDNHGKTNHGNLVEVHPQLSCNGPFRCGWYSDGCGVHSVPPFEPVFCWNWYRPKMNGSPVCTEPTCRNTDLDSFIRALLSYVHLSEPKGLVSNVGNVGCTHISLVHPIFSKYNNNNFFLGGGL